MKRAFPLLLCIILLFNCAGWQCIILYLQEKIQEESFAASADADLISIDQGKGVFHINANELSVNGKLYDIVRVEKTATKAKYLCRADGKEDNLLTNFVSKSDENSPVIKNNKVKTIEFTFPFNIGITAISSITHINVFEFSKAIGFSLKPPFTPPEV
jgi:hypothetical protein